MSTLLLDTTVLIDLSRGNERAADFIEQCWETEPLLAISTISAMELVVGCRNKTEVSQAQGLIAKFSMMHIIPAISSQAYHWLLSYSKSHGLLIPDALIAATAFVHQMTLATNNLKDFQILPQLPVQKPY